MLVAVLTIGDINDTFTRKIEVGAVFGDVNGLQSGDNVWYSGLKVGRVDGLEFHSDSTVEVRMLVDREAAGYIPMDALARLGSDGLIGNRIVVLYGGDPAGASVEDGAILAAGASPSTEDIKAMLQTNNENLLAITTDLKLLTARLAAGDGVAGRLLTDEALSTRVDDTVTALRAAAARADTIAVSVDRFAEHLNRPGALPNDLVTDQRIYPSLVAAGDELEQAARAASGAVARVEAGLADDGSPLGVLVADPAAGADLKSVLVRLDTSAQLLTEDLEAAQHNFLLRGYFRKQERAAARAARDAAPPREPTQ